MNCHERSLGASNVNRRWPWIGLKPQFLVRMEFSGGTRGVGRPSCVSRAARRRASILLSRRRLTSPPYWIVTNRSAEARQV